MLLLDTQTLIWLADTDPRLGRQARQFLLKAMQEGKATVSAITYLEIGYLERKGRVALQRSLPAWRQRVLEGGIAEIEVCAEVAMLAALLAGFHPDPWDRVITATALRYEAALMTSDRSILRWKGGLKCLDARK